MNKIFDSLPGEFKDVLSNEEVRRTQIIQGALGFGVFSFALVAMVIALSSTPSMDEGMESDNLYTMLTAVHVFMALSLYPAAQFLFSSIAKRKSKEILDRINADSVPEDRVKELQDCLGVMRLVIIMRLALFESVSFIGIIIILLGGIEGALQDLPWLWLNLFSALVMMALVLGTFPTRTRLEDLFREKILCEAL